MDHRFRAPRPCRGFVITETCAALALIGLVLAMASLLMTRHAAATDFFLNYRRAQLAAESTVELMRIGSLAVEDREFVDPAGVTITIRRFDAEEPWRPLQRVHVTAKVLGKHSRIIKYSLNTYVVPPQGSSP